MSTLRDTIKNAADDPGDKSPRANRTVNLLNFDSDDLENLDFARDVQLTPVQADQLSRVMKHMELIARTEGGFDNMQEKSLSRLIEKCDPKVQKAISLNRRLVENMDAAHGRLHLFDEERPTNRAAMTDSQRALADRFEHEDIVSGLHEKLGTPTVDQQQSDDSPPSLRETIETFVPETEE